jgi:hypothetical protein
MVWENVKGPIPEGYCVRHRDKNRSNNAIENLELLSRTTLSKSSPHLNQFTSPNGSQRKRRSLAERVRVEREARWAKVAA